MSEQERFASNPILREAFEKLQWRSRGVNSGVERMHYSEAAMLIAEIERLQRENEVASDPNLAGTCLSCGQRRVVGASQPCAEPSDEPTRAAVNCALRHADEKLYSESIDALALKRLAEEVRRLRASQPVDLQTPASHCCHEWAVIGGVMSSAGYDYTDHCKLCDARRTRFAPLSPGDSTFLEQC